MKKLLSILVMATVSLAIIFAGGNTESNNGSVRIGISKILAHPALDASEQGIQDYLNSKGGSYYFDLQNANGEASTGISIAQQFKSSNMDFVIGIGTPTAQALANVYNDIPVIYVAVTDPVSAGLTANNVCGTSDLTPVESQVKVFAEQIKAKTLGNIYTSSEANGVVLNQMFVDACKKYGIVPISVAVANTAEVKQAAQSIVDRIDGMYIATDNAVISALASIADECTKAKIALMTADTSNLDQLDFTVGMGFNYYNLGVQAGKVIEGILNGKKASDFGVVYLTDPADFETWVNLDNAKKIGVTFTQDFLDSATVIIENGKVNKK